MRNLSIVDALNRLRPNAQWTLRGDATYECLEWQDESSTKPSEVEVIAAMAAAEADYAAKQYQRQRAAEYPPMADYLDAVVKGDQQQIQAYIDACLAVKAKYPKPTE